MKKTLGFMVLILLSIGAFSQENFQDVVYLKNGSIIHGLIIEQVPNKSIKIQTTDKNIFVYQMDEIEKLTKEAVGSKVKKNNLTQKRKGYIGLSLGPSIPIGDFADESNGLAKTGLNLTLVNFGYLFAEIGRAHV